MSRENVHPEFLASTDVIDWQHDSIRSIADELKSGSSDELSLIGSSFEWARDNIQHSIDYDRDEITCSASEVLSVGSGFCYAKSHLLAALLRANGLSAIFRPGVEGAISLRFDNAPPKQAFEQLLTERGLAYEYNAATRTVTIYKDAAVSFEPPTRTFIALADTDFSAIRKMLIRFGIGLEGVEYDAATNTVSLHGRDDRIREIADLIAKVESAARARAEQRRAALERRKAERRAQIEADIYAEM